METLTNEQFKSLLHNKIPASLEDHFIEDIEFMIEEYGEANLAIYELSGDLYEASVLELEELTVEELDEIRDQARSIITLR